MLKGKLAAVRPRKSSKVRNLTEKSCSDGYLSLADDLSKEMKRLLVDEDGSHSGIFYPDSSSDRASGTFPAHPLGGGILSSPRKLPPAPSSERMERKKLRFDTSQVARVGQLSGRQKFSSALVPHAVDYKHWAIMYNSERTCGIRRAL